MNTFFIELNGLRSPRKREISGQFGERFYKSLNFLKRHCYEPIGIGDLAKASNMSKRGLNKAFWKHIGQSPGRELRRMRIERAKDLLVSTRLHPREIAEVCGYKSFNTFWVSFRKLVGQSPNKFRFDFNKRPGK